jgi:cytochrome P450
MGDRGTTTNPAEVFMLEVMTQAFQLNPYPLYARMRSQAPLLELVPGEWFAFTHDDVFTALRHPKFSNDERRSNIYEQLKVTKPDIIDRMNAPVLLRLDPPDHTRLRGLVARAFTPTVVASLRETTLELVCAHLDALVTQDSRIEVIEHFAHPVPIKIICALLGVPVEDISQFKAWSAVLARSVDPGFLRDDELNRQINLAGDELGHYLDALANKRSVSPQDDLLSALLAVEQDGDRISRVELIELVQLLLIAGHETTVNLIGNALLALSTHHRERQRLIDDPALIETSIDEFMRFDSPVQLAQRIATEPIQLGRQTLNAGDQVVVLLGAANHDPTVFEQPDQLDVTRDARKQVGFGGGIHHCLGASLARMEATIAIGEFLKRFPHFELAEEPQRRPGFTLRGVSTLRLAVA